MEEEIKLAYGRVSVAGQSDSLEIQKNKFLNQGVLEKDIFVDEKSGKNMEREGLNDLLTEIELIKATEHRNGIKPICLYVSKMDRLGRSTLDMLQLLERFKALGVTVHFLDESLVTGNIHSEMVLKILAIVAEAERIRINERTAEGRANSDKKAGAPISINHEKVIELKEKGLSVAGICKELGIKSRSSVYRILNKKAQ